jgi:hypothetical protein
MLHFTSGSTMEINNRHGTALSVLFDLLSKDFDVVIVCRTVEGYSYFGFQVCIRFLVIGLFGLYS